VKPRLTKGGNPTQNFGRDVEIFANSVAVGISIEDSVGYLSEHGSYSFMAQWHGLWLRLLNGVDLHIALQDFKAICDKRIVDHFCEIVAACDLYQASATAQRLETYADFLDQLGQFEAETSSRLRSAASIAWLALAAPWLMFGILALKPQNLEYFLDSQGLLIILAAVLLSILAKLWSDRIAHLPPLQRAFL
jgi:tight adherence protein B